MWVDNIIFISTSHELNNCFEEELKSKYTITVIRKPKKMLSFVLHQEDHIILLWQGLFINNLLEKFCLQVANPVTTPLDPNIKLDSDKGTHDDTDSQGKHDLCPGHGYATLIGSLVYLVLGTHPDIAFAVNQLAQFTSN